MGLRSSVETYLPPPEKLSLLQATILDTFVDVVDLVEEAGGNLAIDDNPFLQRTIPRTSRALIDRVAKHPKGIEILVSGLEVVGEVCSILGKNVAQVLSASEGTKGEQLRITIK